MKKRSELVSLRSRRIKMCHKKTRISNSSLYSTISLCSSHIVVNNIAFHPIPKNQHQKIYIPPSSQFFACQYVKKQNNKLAFERKKETVQKYSRLSCICIPIFACKSSNSEMIVNCVLFEFMCIIIIVSLLPHFCLVTRPLLTRWNDDLLKPEKPLKILFLGFSFVLLISYEKEQNKIESEFFPRLLQVYLLLLPDKEYYF